jgi:hypothetical protein
MKECIACIKFINAKKKTKNKLKYQIKTWCSIEIILQFSGIFIF